MIHIAQEHFDQAEPLLRRALELQEKAIGPNHVQTAATVDELAGVLGRAEEVQGSREALQAGHRHLRAVRSRENLDLAGVHRALRRDAEEDGPRRRRREDAIAPGRGPIRENVAKQGGAGPRHASPGRSIKGFKSSRPPLADVAASALGQ